MITTTERCSAFTRVYSRRLEAPDGLPFPESLDWFMLAVWRDPVGWEGSGMAEADIESFHSALVKRVDGTDWRIVDGAADEPMVWLRLERGEQSMLVKLEPGALGGTVVSVAWACNRVSGREQQ